MLRKHAILLMPDPPSGGGVTPKDQQAAPKDVDNKPAEGAEPEPEPEPEPAVEEPAAPLEGKDDPLLAALFKDLKDEVPEIKPVDEIPKPEEKPVDKVEDKVEDKTKDKAAEKAKKKKRVEILEELDKPAPAAVTPPAVQPAPTPEPPKAATPSAEEEYIAGLTDEQKEELAEAEYAAKLFPDKYKDRKKKLLAWYKDLDSTASKLITEDATRKLDDTDEDFQKFLKTKPKIDAAHAKRVVRELASDEAERRADAKVQPKLTELDRRQREVEFAPKLNTVMTQLDAAMDELILSDDKSPLAVAIKAIKEKPEAAEDYALERRVMEEEVAAARDMTKEYLLFANGLRAYDDQNPVHKKLLTFINEQGQAMMAQPEEVRVRGGKTFVTRDQYNAAVRKDPDAAKKFWTFSHSDILQMHGIQTKMNMERRLKIEEGRAKQLGFERRKPGNSAAAPKEAKPEPKPLTPPKATPTLAKGAAKSGVAPGSTGPTGDPINVVSVLRLRD